jgi:hypothetical protein
LGTNALSKHLKEVRELAACAAISSSTSSARSSLPVVDVNISYLPFFAKDPRKQENWIIDSMQSMRVSHFPCFSSNTHLTHCFVDRNLRKLQLTSLHIITCFLHRRQMLLYKIISRTIMQTNNLQLCAQGKWPNQLPKMCANTITDGSNGSQDALNNHPRPTFSRTTLLTHIINFIVADDQVWLNKLKVHNTNRFLLSLSVLLNAQSFMICFFSFVRIFKTKTSHTARRFAR